MPSPRTGARATRCDRLPSRGKSGAESTTGWAPTAIDRCVASPIRGARQRLGAVLRDVATLVTPDTILRWHCELIAPKWTYAQRSPGRPRVLAEIRPLMVRMRRRIRAGATRAGCAEEHGPSRGPIYDCHHPQSRGSPAQWRVADLVADVLRAHWPALVAANEVWTAGGWVTYYTVFVIELQSRRVHVAGSTR